MRGLFFQKLAVTGIKKNWQIYLPYLLTCVLTVMMFYILHGMSYTPLLSKMSGGTSTRTALGLGKFVVAVFSFLFLWYSNSFLTKRRTKEFGLYNILGMGKRGLRKIMFWETLISAVIGIAGGLLLGVLFSKLAELCLANILQVEVTDYAFTFEPKAFLLTAEMYCAIFLFLLARSMIKVQFSNPMELFRSENYGEKPPKANWVLALLGLLLLAGAYAIAVSIKSPLAALFIFFIAVIMVVIATYLLFIAGSVVFCKLLKGNKNYYYKKQHFVAVSSMIYRMKRNGAGLASICILSTMVLVMLSSTGSLYFGMRGALTARFSRQTQFFVNVFGPLYDMNDGASELLKDAAHKRFEELDVTPLNELDYHVVFAEGKIEDNVINLDDGYGEEFSSLFSIEEFCMVYFLEANEYNAIMGTDIAPKAGEAYLYTLDCTYNHDDITVGGETWKVAGYLDSMFRLGDDTYGYLSTVVLVVSDLNETNGFLERMKLDENDYYAKYMWFYGYDLNESNEKVLETDVQIRKALWACEAEHEIFRDKEVVQSIYYSCEPEMLEGLLDLYGGLFFIGVLLSFLFLMAAVLIIYYKQISEGFEDQGRFEIMKKVGMTTKDIKRSVNSQVLTVFFAPLLMAGLHLAFAYPLIWKVLKLLMLNNLMYVIFVTVCIYLAFAVFYVLVYKWTAGTYYRIVGGKRK